MGFSLTGLMITGVILLPNLLMILLSPKNAPDKVKSAGALMTVLERVGQAGCFVLPVISKGYIENAEISIWFMLAALSIAFYYGLWLRYALRRDFALLFAPLWRIPVPMAVFPVLAFAFIALWIESVWLGAAALLLAVGHFANSWVAYKTAADV